MKFFMCTGCVNRCFLMANTVFINPPHICLWGHSYPLNWRMLTPEETIEFRNQIGW